MVREVNPRGATGSPVKICQPVSVLKKWIVKAEKENEEDNPTLAPTVSVRA